jgi:hypothetical protein
MERIIFTNYKSIFLGSIVLIALVIGVIIAHLPPFVGGVLVIVLFLIFLSFFYFLERANFSWVDDLKFKSAIFLVIILPFQNTLNLLVGFSLKPLALIPMFFCIDQIVLIFASGKFKKPNFFELFSILLIVYAIIYIPPVLLLPFDALDALFGSVLGFFVQLQGLLYYFFIVNIRLTPQRTRRLFVCIIVVLFVLVGYGVYEYLFDQYGLADFLVKHSNHPAISGVEVMLYRQRYYAIEPVYRSMSFELDFVSLGYYGFFLSSVFFALVLLNPYWRGKIGLWGLLLIAIFGLLSSLTISAIGCFVISCVIIWWVWREKIKLAYTIVLVTLAIVIFLGAILGIPGVTERIQDVFMGKDIQFASHRELNSRLWSEEFFKYVFGRGTGVSGNTAINYFEGYFIENEYIGNVSEWGWAGFLLYIFFIFSLLGNTWRLSRIFPKGSVRRALSVGLFTVTIGYILIGFYHNVWGQSNVDVLFLTLLALLQSGDWSKIEHTGLEKV